MSGNTVTILDVILGLGVLLSGLVGVLRGFTREVFGVAAWVGAGFISLHGLALTGSFFRALIPLETWIADLVVVAIIFLISLLMLSLLFRLIVGLMMRAEMLLGPLDCFLGLFFGLFRGALVVSFAYFLVDSLVQPVNRPIWLGNAGSLFLMERGSAMIHTVVPNELASTARTVTDAVVKHMQKIQEAE